MEFNVVNYDSPQYKQGLELREKLLQIPLGLRMSKKTRDSERDEIHAVAIEKDHVVGVALLKENGNGTLRMRQVAIERAFQGKGLGRELVTFAEKVAKFNGCSCVELLTRSTSSPFYRKLGYKETGHEVKEMGIPHIPMQKELILPE
ncbi:MAG: GNAT family N-acetyltransferase [Bacteroidetes bacterium]|jgi:predicted GNAT family N-acyltransferase|nr:GNAT family N-acetyltransferase [Bacteroidota bacterium]